MNSRATDGVTSDRWTASPDELLHALGQWRDGTISDDEFYERAHADLLAMCSTDGVRGMEAKTFALPHALDDFEKEKNRG